MSRASARLAIHAALLFLAAAAPLRGEDPGEGSVPIGPYLQALLDTSVWVVWESREAGLGSVSYRVDGGAVATVEGTAPTTRHRILLQGLLPDTRYAYEILLDGRALGGPFAFRTSPPRGEGTVRFAVTGDSGSADENQAAVAALIRSLAPDLFLHAGDLSYRANLQLTVFEPYREILANSGFYPTLGNHDIFFVPNDFFIPPSPNPEGTGTYYSFDWASAHFVALDTNWLAFNPDGPQVDWLVADLERARASAAKWLVLLFHECVYTVGGYSIDDRRSEEVIPPIADRFGVDLVLTAHDHNYQRTYPVRDGSLRDAWQDPGFVSPGGTVYVVTGGGGGVLYGHVGGKDEPLMRLFVSRFHAVLVDISPTVLTVQAVDVGGTVFDSFSIRKDVPRPEFRFVRGDADMNGVVELTDAVLLLGYLFLGEDLECPETADPSGEPGPLGIEDPIHILNFLFRGGPPPVSPFPECGSDPRIDPDLCTKAACREP